MTQTAEVVVNSATSGSFHVPALVEIGSIRKKVPTVITARNPRQMVREMVMEGLTKKSFLQLTPKTRTLEYQGKRRHLPCTFDGAGVCLLG